MYQQDLKNYVTFIKICREKQLNALNKEVINSLEEILDFVEKESTIRSVIITGEGEKPFVDGADIKEIKSFKKEEAND